MSLIDDYKAYAKHDESSLKPFFKIHLYCLMIFRISHLLYKWHLTPLSKIFWFINRIFFSIDIDPGARLKGGVVILHGTGIVIGRYVMSKGDFKIYQGATLGGNQGKESVYDGEKFSQPIIMNGSIIGINSAVLGPVVIGENTIVGTNTVVTKSVPENSIVVGINKILKK
ncbi:serine O-acetyltransferase [Leeuwenhoekiella aestuarii]|uniref:serine O-acetyltransferase n=1 Tax=Leeuwenhoekiella aestuarii TaxID=2249426 RepID=UPI000FFE7506|nr:serine acetyltransferase [Leeuwenhoekiella aestuarii]RXG12922.1 serine O-acetyltransferase [Leeuwenhoekiella aestuarii]